MVKTNMKTVCEFNKCTGCMACIDICPKHAVEIKDDLQTYKAVIDETLCIECNACYQVCQNHSPAFFKQPLGWKQGWVQNELIREQASSGGLATEIARAFVAQGGIAFSCVFEKGTFGFSSADKEEDVKKFAGSKYIKSNPAGIYKQILSQLKSGRKVLFLGLPCQVAAVKNYVKKQEFLDLLYTVDLICHGTPSPKILELFLNQHGKSQADYSDIQFRKKGSFQLWLDGASVTPSGVRDPYLISFLNMLTYTENCYSCPYACRERVSDMTLGDSWGSELSVEEQKKGISLVTWQTDKGMELLSNGGICLMDVDVEKAVSNNQQLNHPADRPQQREQFFKEIEKGIPFNRAVAKCYPKQSARQNIKAVLKRMKLM